MGGIATEVHTRARAHTHPEHVRLHTTPTEMWLGRLLSVTESRDEGIYEAQRFTGLPVLQAGKSENAVRVQASGGGSPQEGE